MENITAQKFDTPYHIDYIKQVSEAFNEAKKHPDFKIPAGDWWQRNQSVNFYHGFFSGIMAAVNGISVLGKVPGATPESLLSELQLMCGQVANLIVENAPKIISLEKAE